MQLHAQELDGPFSGTRLAWVEHGEPAAPDVVVCVHGLTRNAHDFDDLAQALAERGRRVLAVDVMGRGRSSWAADPKAYAVPVYAAQIGRLLEILDLPPVDWIGTSMGGLIGLALAAQERPPLRRLVLNDVGPLIPAAGLWPIKAYLGLDLSFASLDELEQHLRQIHQAFGPLDDAQWQRMARHSARRDGDRFRMHYDPAIREGFAELGEQDLVLWEAWDRITVPTLLLRGELSTLLPAEVALQMTRRGPRAELVEIKGVGHAPALVDPAQIAIVRDWLDRPPRAAPPAVAPSGSADQASAGASNT
jgi:pimeloyl-ACP methyl ester carboxylesterase